MESISSDSVLPLIDETFENSVTGNRGGDAAKEKPFRKHARCSAQNHVVKPCGECESIEKNLKYENQTRFNKDRKNTELNLNGGDEHLNLMAIKPCFHSNDNENVWHVAHIDKYDTMGKFAMSPITVCSASALTNHSALKFGLESSSFIILNDQNENDSHFFPNITTTGETDQTPMQNDAHQSKIENTFDRPCDDCCFCNPSLHNKRHNGTKNSPKKCNFCSSRQQSTQTTPATSTRLQDKGQSINKHNNTTKTSAPMERIYERKYRSNHTHTRTHSRESDTINTKCTRKTNDKIRKTLLSGSDDRINANTDLTRNKTAEGNGNDVNDNKTTKQKSSIPKLPPANTDWITNSKESATSPSSSNSTGSSTKSHRRQDSKSVPNLPRPERWQNSSPNTNIKTQKSRTNSRYQHFFGDGKSSATDECTAVTSNETESKSKPTGNLIDKCWMCVPVSVYVLPLFGLVSFNVFIESFIDILIPH